MDRVDHSLNDVLLLDGRLLFLNLVAQQGLPSMLPSKDPKIRLVRHRNLSKNKIK